MRWLRIFRTARELQPEEQAVNIVWRVHIFAHHQCDKVTSLGSVIGINGLSLCIIPHRRRYALDHPLGPSRT